MSDEKIPLSQLSVHAKYTTAASLSELVQFMPGLYELNRDCLGCVYAFEVGEVLKIGFTGNAYQRLNTWLSTYGTVGVDVGRAAITVPHIDARASETILHHMFEEKRLTGSRREFFRISLDAFLAEVQRLPISTPTAVELAMLREDRLAKAEAFVGAMKNFITTRPTGALSPHDTETEGLLKRLETAKSLVPMCWDWIVRAEFAKFDIILSTNMAWEIAQQCLNLSIKSPWLSDRAILDFVTSEHAQNYLDS